VTLNGSVAVITHHVLFYTKWQLSEPTASNWLKLDPYCQQQKCSPGSLGFGSLSLMGDNVCFHCSSWACCYEGYI